MPPEGLSIVVPVYNEADNFPRVVTEVEKHVPGPYTLYMVYDFDADNTVPVAQKLAENRPWLKLVKNTLGRGVVNALRMGFETAPDGPVLVVMGDLSDDLAVVPRTLELYREGYQIVCPSRYMRGGQQIGGPPLKKFLSWLAGQMLKHIARFPVQDATNNFRLYDGALVRSLGIESAGGFEVALELTAKAFRNRVKITEVPSTWRDRTSGESRFQMMKWIPRYLYWFFYAFHLIPKRPTAQAPIGAPPRMPDASPRSS